MTALRDGDIVTGRWTDFRKDTQAEVEVWTPAESPFSAAALTGCRLAVSGNRQKSDFFVKKNVFFDARTAPCSVAGSVRPFEALDDFSLQGRLYAGISFPMDAAAVALRAIPPKGKRAGGVRRVMNVSLQGAEERQQRT